jgi:alkyl sulfatase BDS1-like metallo-beta-lactamase superfamily hydrolase
MSVLEKLSDDLWTEKTSTAEAAYHPFATENVIEELATGVAFFKSFSNVTGVRTGEGLVLIDTGSFHPVAHERSFNAVRSWNGERLATAVYTHGHADHAYGLPPFLAEAKAKGWARPEIVGHCAVRCRMQRYIETAGYNSVINERQFGFRVEWPTEPIYPTVEYERALDLNVGGVAIELHHGKGETDDHTWAWLPATRTLCTGDFFIWAAPNAGNPQKVQRYIPEWAQALRAMATKGAELLLPGHGVPVFGAERVHEVLTHCAAYLESLYRQTIDLMNAGAGIDALIHEVRPPEALAAKPYLRPIYDEPEFIVRNIHRCYGGWYGGAPSELKPAPRGEQAREIAALAGGVEVLLGRAAALAEAGELRLACHLVDWAAEAAPESAEARRVRGEVYAKRLAGETSTMAKGVFGAVVRETKGRG